LRPKRSGKRQREVKEKGSWATLEMMMERGFQRTLSSNVFEKMAPRASGSLIAESDDPLATTHCHASTRAKASWLYFETLFIVPLASCNIFPRSATGVCSHQVLSLTTLTVVVRRRDRGATNVDCGA
jgi:hypothetical protein